MFTPGDKLEFGHYTILRELGSGGMGVVFQCRDEYLQREIAIKMMLPELMAETDTVEIFRQEARLAGQLEHPGIVTIHNIGVENREGKSHHYIAMEFLPGGSLRKRIGKEKLALEQVLEWMKQLSLALNYAHKRGVVHQDIKPDNIFITQDANLKIGDFGLALIATGPAFERQTQGKGSPAYMSPELCLGEPRDHRSDIYSLGAVFFEMLTGERPFKAHGMIEMALKHATAPLPSAAKIRQDIPPVLDKALKHMMAKQPDERLQTLADLLPTLEKLLLEMKAARLGVTFSQAAPVIQETPASLKPAIKLETPSHPLNLPSRGTIDCSPSSEETIDDHQQDLDKSNKITVKETATSPLPTERNSSPPTERNSPLPNERNSSPPTERNSPLSTERNSSPPTERNSPLPTERNSSPPTGRNSPLPTGRNSPLPTERNSPLPTERNSSSAIERKPLDPEKEITLDLIWTYKTGGPIGWSASPVVNRVRKQIYLSSADFVLYALDMNTGAYSWHFKTGSPLVAGVLSLEEEIFCPCADGSLYCLSAADGNIIWKFKGASPIVSNPVGTADSIIITALDGSLKSLSRKDGSINWIYRCDNSIICSAQIVDSLVFVASKDKRLYALDLSKGYCKWLTEANAPFLASVLASSDSVYCASMDGRIVSVEIDTGSKTWDYLATGSFICKGNLEFSSLNYCTKNGRIYSLDKFKGNLLWSEDAAGSVLGGITSVAGDLYVSSSNGIIHSFKAKTGELNWFMSIPNALESAPLITSSLIYQGTIDGELYAYAAPHRAK